MAGQLIPPAELPPTVPPIVTPEPSFAIWFDLQRTGERLLLAGLRREIGPAGDLRAAYRDWYTTQMREHDQVVTRMLDRMRCTGDQHGN